MRGAANKNNGNVCTISNTSNDGGTQILRLYLTFFSMLCFFFFVGFVMLCCIKTRKKTWNIKISRETIWIHYTFFSHYLCYHSRCSFFSYIAQFFFLCIHSSKVFLSQFLPSIFCSNLRISRRVFLTVLDLFFSLFSLLSLSLCFFFVTTNEFFLVNTFFSLPCGFKMCIFFVRPLVSSNEMVNILIFFNEICIFQSHSPSYGPMFAIEFSEATPNAK